MPKITQPNVVVPGFEPDMSNPKTHSFQAPTMSLPQGRLSLGGWRIHKTVWRQEKEQRKVMRKQEVCTEARQRVQQVKKTG